MTKILVLYYSAYGHIERMAQAVADGVCEKEPKLTLPCPVNQLLIV